MKREFYKLVTLSDKMDLIKCYNDVCTEYNINQSDFMIYSGIIKSIPSVWKRQLKGSAAEEILNECLIDIKGKAVNVRQTNYKNIYFSLVIRNLVRSKANLSFSEQYNIDDDEWKKIYLLPHSFKLSNKAKEIHYKILHNYVATGNLMYKMKIINSPRCNFCDLYKQTSQHLFFDCTHVKNFWFRISDLLRDEYGIFINITLKDVLFGHVTILNYELINKILIYAKLYIYNCKCQEKDLVLNSFINFFKKNVPSI